MGRAIGRALIHFKLHFLDHGRAPRAVSIDEGDLGVVQAAAGPFRLGLRDPDVDLHPRYIVEEFFKDVRIAGRAARYGDINHTCAPAIPTTMASSWNLLP